METTTKRSFYSVPDCKLAELLEAIAKLNKRARRLKLPEIQVTTEVDYVAHHFVGYAPYWGVGDQGGTIKSKWIPEAQLDEVVPTLPEWWKPDGYVMPWHEVTITGESPKLDGWRFVATLEPVHTDGQPMNLVLAVPGETCPAKYMAKVGHCDHCNKKRRRNQTFVVKHDDGRTMMVGRGCLKDFTGHKDPKTLAQWAELLSMATQIGHSGEEDDDFMLGSYNPPPIFSLAPFLVQTAACMRVRGWLSRGKAHENEQAMDGPAWATCDRVLYIMDPPQFTGPHAEEERAKWEAEKAACAPTDADHATAEAALAWGQGLDLEALMEGDSGYMANIAVVARAGYVEAKSFGLGASMVRAYLRTLEQAKETAKKPESRHVGTVKVRAEYKVQFQSQFATEGQWGTTYIVRMLGWDDAAGCYANNMVWFASHNPCWTEGQELYVKATVKKHGEFKGTAQTVVNRVVVLQEQQPELGVA